MQLHNIDHNEIRRLDEFLNPGVRLAKLIDTPPDNNLVFSSELERNPFFSKLAGAFGESSTPLKKRSKDERMHLKEKLLEDMRDNLSRAKTKYEGDLLFGSETLPSDPGTCNDFLDTVEDRVHAQIRELNAKLLNIGQAREKLELLQTRKKELERFDESVFTSMPPELEQPCKKKPKSG
jgi:hypothetical protein